MIRRTVVGLAVLALAVFAGLQMVQNRVLQGENATITASKTALESELGKVRGENLALTGRISAAEERITRLEMVASWYGPGLNGRLAADGSVFNQDGYTCAHKTLPFGTVLVVEGNNGRRVPVIVTDRGPFVKGRDIDLSKATAELVGLIHKGVDQVTVYQFRL